MKVREAHLAVRGPVLIACEAETAVRRKHENQTCVNIARREGAPDLTKPPA
jgi:hypothetical protein